MITFLDVLTEIAEELGDDVEVWPIAVVAMKLGADVLASMRGKHEPDEIRAVVISNVMEIFGLTRNSNLRGFDGRFEDLRVQCIGLLRRPTDWVSGTAGPTDEEEADLDQSALELLLRMER